jgi:hypothetical protein
MDGQLALLTELVPTVHICIPPELEEDALALAAENPPIHPAWAKARRKGRHFVLSTNNLDDISEIADFARCCMEEPAAPLTKAKRQALQILLDRAYRHAELEPMGHCHCMAVKWRDKPLSTNAVAKHLRSNKKR